ncbi:hypothetical protein VNO80_13937 [Phaseolus coccineus]|uniref:Cytochrome P450 n=1 Tax=Phaseolus coccineus TaxID=3886 RepID=A0AAN9N1T5_PHACN
MAKESFTTIDMAVSSRPKIVAIEIMGYNHAVFGFAPYGPYWRELRNITTLEILSPRRVEQLQHVRVSEVQNSIKELYNLWCSQKSETGYALVELKQWFSHLAFNMVLRMVVGKRYFGGENLQDEKTKRCVKAVEDFMHLLGVFTVGDAIPWLRWFDFGGHEKAMKETGKALDSIISEELEEHRKRKGLGEKVDEAQDFMDVMISLLDGRTIEGIDDDTMIKSIVLTPHRTLGALADKYGPIFTIQLGSKKTLVINNWEIAKECFTTNDMVVSSRPKLVAAELMGYNHAMFGFAPYGHYWRELRKITTLEILTTRRVEQLQHVRVTEVQNWIKELYNLWCSQRSESGYALVELKL